MYVNTIFIKIFNGHFTKNQYNDLAEFVEVAEDTGYDFTTVKYDKEAVTHVNYFGAKAPGSSHHSVLKH